MLSWFDKMEKKVGRYAISNLTLYLLIAYGIGYMTRFLMPELLQWLTLEPGLILKGQIWRIVSWIFVAPAEKPIYFLLMVWLYYSLGTTLERTWGTFRYNVYIISGMLFSVIGAFVAHNTPYSTNAPITVNNIPEIIYTLYRNVPHVRSRVVPKE